MSGITNNPNFDTTFTNVTNIMRKVAEAKLNPEKRTLLFDWIKAATIIAELEKKINPNDQKILGHSIYAGILEDWPSTKVCIYHWGLIYTSTIPNSIIIPTVHTLNTGCFSSRWGTPVMSISLILPLNTYAPGYSFVKCCREMIVYGDKDWDPTLLWPVYAMNFLKYLREKQNVALN